MASATQRVSILIGSPVGSGGFESQENSVSPERGVLEDAVDPARLVGGAIRVWQLRQVADLDVVGAAFVGGPPVV